MTRRRHDIVASIYPTTRGFAFTLFEGPLSPVDWGVIEIRGLRRNRRCLIRIEAILRSYQPDVLVLQDMSEAGTQRARRIRDLNAMIQTLADEMQTPTRAYSRASVREHFVQYGSPTKENIAAEIARHVPAFDQYLPPRRKPWMSEDARMGLFDAAAFALTYFADTRERQDAR